jgi:uncharacterized 2Fe-2S/4Fe-4S cluster protein (DUF4445 family)
MKHQPEENDKKTAGNHEKWIKIVFRPGNTSSLVLEGTNLLEAASQAGYIIETPCGGAGKCGKCAVRIVSGVSEPSVSDKKLLPANKLNKGYRLACQTYITTPIVVEIPETCLRRPPLKIQTHGKSGEIKPLPRISSQILNLSHHLKGEIKSDADILMQVTGSNSIDLPALQSLPRILRSSNYQVTVIKSENTIIDIKPGNAEQKCYGIAFDIGTTSLVGILVNLNTGEELSIATSINPQTLYGADIISRVKMCRETPDGLSTLQKSILTAINGMINSLLQNSGVPQQSVYEVVFSGNSVMQEILAGIDPSPLGEIPFQIAFNDPLYVEARDLGLHINQSGKVLFMPQIGGFIGGDIVSGIIATQLDTFNKPVLFIDIGTNGEMILSYKGKLMGTSVAAGPAFEGARITHGMRGTVGAIEAVRIENGDIKIEVIGNVSPKGICGSALVDIVAVLLDTGIIDTTGRFLEPDELPADLPELLRKRVKKHNGQTGFEIAGGTNESEPVFIYQSDIREVQLATAAIRTGITLLLKTEKISQEHLEHIIIAGGFGSFIRPTSALRIGMLPDINPERILVAGNTSLSGAKRVLLSSAEESYAKKIARRVIRFDISQHPDFASTFADSMVFPDKS